MIARSAKWDAFVGRLRGERAATNPRYERPAQLPLLEVAPSTAPPLTEDEKREHYRLDLANRAELRRRRHERDARALADLKRQGNR